MKFLFLITSAVQTKFGVYSAAQRLEQTLATIASVRAAVPADQLKIVVIETSGEEPAQSALDTLTGAVDHVIRFTADPWVADLYNRTDNWDVVKNATEIVTFGTAIGQLIEQNQLADVDRVFKLSGRYWLDENFDIKQYVDPAIADKIVVKQAMRSQFDPVTTGGVTHQYMSRLWSFPGSCAGQIVETYEQMIQAMATRVKSGGYIDIEHLLYQYLDHSMLVEMPIVGVSGKLGPNGNTVHD